MPPANADGYIDLAHHDGIAATHVASIALDQIGALILSSGKSRGVIEDAAVAAIGRIPGDIARALWLRIDPVMHRKVAVAVDRGAERHALVLGETGFLERRQRALGPVEEFGAILYRIGARDFDIVRIKQILEGDRTRRDAALEDAGEFHAGFERAGDGLDILLADRPQHVLDLLCKLGVRRLEPRQRAGPAVLADADTTGADAVESDVEVLVQRQTRGLRSRNQDALRGNLIDWCVDRTRRGRNLDLEIAGQALLLATVLAPALAEQHGAAGLELVREDSHRLAGAGDAFAMAGCLFGCNVDLGGAVADRDDELRGGARIVGHLADGAVLLGDRAIDVVEDRTDRLDCLGNPVHGLSRACGVLLQRLDFPGDLFRRALGLHRERLHLGGDHRKAAAGFTGARRLDGGVERKQRGLARDLRDQIDDVADGGGGFTQAIDIDTRLVRGRAGLVGELAGVAHLRADAFGRTGEFLARLGKARRGATRSAAAPRQRVGPIADDGKGRGVGFGAAGD